jgi:superfamily II DNA/RNA helicase
VESSERKNLPKLSLTCLIYHEHYILVPAGRLVRFFFHLFNVGLGIPVLEIHSRMSQASRNRASGSFREARRGVLFTTDVSARGRSLAVVQLPGYHVDSLMLHLVVQGWIIPKSLW